MLLSIFLTTWIIISSKNKTHLIEPQKMVVSIIEKGDYMQTLKIVFNHLVIGGSFKKYWLYFHLHINL